MLSKGQGKTGSGKHGKRDTGFTSGVEVKDDGLGTGLVGSDLLIRGEKKTQSRVINKKSLSVQRD